MTENVPKQVPQSMIDHAEENSMGVYVRDVLTQYGREDLAVVIGVAEFGGPAFRIRYLEQPPSLDDTRLAYQTFHAAYEALRPENLTSARPRFITGDNKADTWHEELLEHWADERARLLSSCSAE